MPAPVVIRLLIAAEVRLYRDGVADVFARVPDVEVVATASDAAEAVRTAAELAPDVALVDLGAHPDVALVRTFAEAAPHARVIALAVHEVEHDVIALAEAGVAGYVTRDQSIAELVDAVRSVAAGEMRCSPWLAATLLRRVTELARDRVPPQARPRLTAREQEIVELLEQGLSNKEIAARLRIELPTVKNHVHNILEKLDVRRRGEAAAAARSGQL
jgi:two-component system nitrate/nitrite response regulator NarL